VGCEEDVGVGLDEIVLRSRSLRYTYTVGRECGVWTVVALTCGGNEG